jgi:predicted DCC family thiol-disulfide oxidoreductase YuxK
MTADRPDPPPGIGAEECVVLFDGVCNMCNGWVRFFIRYDPKAKLRFASLQSDVGQAILNWKRLPTDRLETVVFLERGRVHLRSTAVLRVALYLSPPWPLAAIGLLVPRPLRDWLYRQVARRRYAWFGRREQCMIPTADVQRRFL